MRNNHLTNSRWPNEYDQKICAWPKRSHRQTWAMEVDRKSTTTTNMNDWIWPNQKIKIISLSRPTSRCECDRKFLFRSYSHVKGCCLNDCIYLRQMSTKHALCSGWISNNGLQHKVKIMAGTEPHNEDSSPPHCEAQTVKLKMEEKMVQIKKW